MPSAACGHEADSCVRVHHADVLTLLLLTLYGGAVPADNEEGTAAGALRALAAESLAAATPLLRAEVAILQGQLLTLHPPNVEAAATLR